LGLPLRWERDLGLGFKPLYHWVQVGVQRVPHPSLEHPSRSRSQNSRFRSIALPERLRTVPELLLKSLKRRRPPRVKKNGSIGCGDNPRNQTGESAPENTQTLPAVQPSDAPVSDLPSCTRHGGDQDVSSFGLGQIYRHHPNVLPFHPQWLASTSVKFK
jgi:hypothetical protein